MSNPFDKNNAESVEDVVKVAGVDQSAESVVQAKPPAPGDVATVTPAAAESAEDEVVQVAEEAPEDAQTKVSAEMQAQIHAAAERLARSQARGTAPETNEPFAQFSSGRIMRFRLGRFQFEKGLLTLRKQSDIDDFTRVLMAASPRTQATVAAVNREAVRQFNQSFAETVRARGVDTSDSRGEAPREQG